MAAAAMFLPPSFANLAKFSVSPAISFNTCAGATPSALANSPVALIRFKFVSSDAPFIDCNDFNNLPIKSWPRLTDFDDKLAETVDWSDVANWNPDCTIGMRMHNFYLFKDAIQQVEHYIDGHNYILEQVVDKDTYTVLMSIDEMVKSDKPIQVFEKYKHLYKKLSNTKKEHSYASNQFFG